MRVPALIVTASLVCAGLAYAQYPITEAVAGRVMQKYQSSSCEQLWQNRGKPAGTEEQRILNVLRSDPHMRQAFFEKIAGPFAK